MPPAKAEFAVKRFQFRVILMNFAGVATSPPEKMR